MNALAPRTRQALERLEALLASPTIPPRVARNCERLVEKLRRPIHVGLIGVETESRERLLAALVGDGVLPEGVSLPTTQIGHADTPFSKATLADTTRLTTNGLPEADLLRQHPVFLEVGAPLDALRRVSFLYLAVGDDAGEQAAALRWAARRVDFVLWCTRDFAEPEAAIWAAAPPDLKNHAYLVAFASEQDTHGLRARKPDDFQRIVFLADGADGVTDVQAGARILLNRLQADINDAIAEDVDAAALLLHRFGKPDPGPAPLTPSDLIPDKAAPEAAPLSADTAMVDLLSEPIIFLKRRARDIFESLEWQQDPTDEWASDVLDHCYETADGLRERAAEWPQDDDRAPAFQTMIDDAADMVTLLQIEGGPRQAQDAAALLLQLRTEFEARLAAHATLAI